MLIKARCLQMLLHPSAGPAWNISNSVSNKSLWWQLPLFQQRKTVVLDLKLIMFLCFLNVFMFPEHDLSLNSFFYIRNIHRRLNENYGTL